MATIINNYEYYLTNNKLSLLNQILGVFTFCNNDIMDNKQSYFIQRNLLVLDKIYLLRAYDLKGST